MALPLISSMPRRLPPLLLAIPSRYAGSDQASARASLLLLVAAIVLALAASTPATMPAILGGSEAAAQAVVAAVAQGRGYHQATLELMRDAAAGPALAIAPPPLTLVLAAIPRWLAATLLAALAVTTLVVWSLRLRPVLGTTTHLVATGLIAAGLAAAIAPDTIGAASLWGGLLLLLSVGLWRPSRWVTPAALGLAAAAIAPAASVYLAVMAIAAAVEGQRREAAGFGAALLVALVALALHLAAIEALAPDTAWVALGRAGIGFTLAAWTAATPLLALPSPIAFPLLLLAAFGWTAWPDAARGRLLCVAVICSAVLAVAATADDWRAAALPAPLLLVGLALAPDGLRDLVRAAISRPRITVTRRVR